MKMFNDKLKKKIPLQVLIIFFSVLTSISALQINDTTFIALDINYTIKVDTITLDKVVITSITIQFYNLTSSDSNFTNTDLTYQAIASFYGLNQPINDIKYSNGTIVSSTESDYDVNISIPVGGFIQVGDYSGPIITIIQPNAQDYIANPIPFEVTTDELATCYYSFDGESNVTLTTSDNRTHEVSNNLGNGDHTIVYNCQDSLGNLAVSSTISFRVAITGSSSVGSSSFTSTTIKDPKTVILEYPSEWERGENIEIVVNSYTSLNRLIIPEEINVIEVPEGVNLIGTRKGEKIKNVIKTFEITSITKLGKTTVELLIIDERNVTATANFTIVDNIEDKKDLVSKLKARWILYSIWGLVILFAIIVIVQLISYSRIKK